MIYSFTTEIAGRTYECELQIEFDKSDGEWSNIEVIEPKRLAKGVREQIIHNAINGGIDWEKVERMRDDHFESLEEMMGEDW